MVLSSADIFFKISLFVVVVFPKNLSGISVDCQAVWIQIMPAVLSGLIWVQIVCKDYQQMALISKEFMTTIKDSELGYIVHGHVYSREIFFEESKPL